MAKAIQYLEPNALQRLFIDNCGMTGNQLNVLLVALMNRPTFRSIVYSMNSLNDQSIISLNQMLVRKPPLQELKLIDCNLRSTQIETIMDELIA